ncbi:phosphoribosylglycinamide formyltransferase [Clostridium bornimense]|uniref:phosphoribosylglycinamide formyltransferase n=1 Tax=Clostridium bornimense TaxID=1216932 RepID=UPI001C100EB9|nr:phosphoribosylglycinamide formyltransferase [Clostridium bornimense]MBU5316443.1 phosphoribosylglycinamide formyltransferase [Clostridium bornimense]
MLKIAVLVSGGGSNLQAIIDKVSDGYLDKVAIEYVISDTKGAYALERAEKVGIKTLTYDKKEYGDSLSKKILDTLKGKVDVIVLAGFFSIIKKELIDEFRNRIINIHPSLIPSFCGKGAYGIHVHEKAIEYGVKISGCTVHFVDEGTDTGAIILQKSVPVYGEDTPKKLQERILVEEHKALPEALKLISEGKVRVEGRKTIIK